jgi:hypothetical protein
MSAHDETYGNRGLKENLAKNRKPNVSNSEFIVKMVVIDILLEPGLINKEKLAFYKNVLRVKNIENLIVAPRNSIIAKFIQTNNTMATANEDSFVVPPFFPSHLSLPCKAGEVVWCYFDNVNDKESYPYYWISKVPTNNLVDDVNHTHYPRMFDFINIALSAKEAQEYANLSEEEKASKLKKTFENKIIYSKNEKDITDNIEDELAGTLEFLDKINKNGEQKFGWNNDNPFLDILQDSDGSRITAYEAVPRFQKRPSDIAIEGSNNTLIVLGTDRQGPAFDFELDSNGLTKLKPTGELKSGAGAIDIVVGRGQSDTTAGKVAINTLQRNEIEKNFFETKSDVANNNFKSFEGDPSFRFDKSRIYVSQNSIVDRLISKNNSESFNSIVENNSEEASCIVLKSDKIRLVARKDFQIIVKSDDSDDNDENLENYSSITLKSSGEIIIKPSKDGVIKLGSENASKPILCSGIPANPVGGIIQGASPIISSLGSTIGAGGANGTFSKKVLIE